MKRAKHAGSHPASKARLYASAHSSLAESVAFATLCLVGIAGVLVALISASMPPGARSSPLADTARYLHSGQTAADLRTMTAIVEYLLDKEPSLATNLVQLRGNERQFAQPTNVNALKPKV